MHGLNGWSQSAGYRLGREHKPDTQLPLAPPAMPVDSEVDIHGEPSDSTPLPRANPAPEFDTGDDY